ncbi:MULTISPECIES: aldo/keto reductase [Phytobacter]|uniref:Aldo/keto reductase n=1 Tax=Phytobacter diazotrophicus TaxID=395631 RepID=A0ABN6LUK3_9ENTR|nr:MULTISPECIES: aldo/keto reductase [Phytobacter]MDU4153450.1 aldo/keto reductase [Enterobacteriaceae bacterium]MDU7376772.1 aldo/keto reductase [Enterobacteriaceae bacterium]BBE78257.1 aldo/keto reductase [Phytobacter sp. MRY16-398]BDD51634.1 aldo/keto reductase [Phytobacter diazotrophicus]BEG85282.1 aldo/keto reductase [Phytobacter diazotrophicus]
MQHRKLGNADFTISPIGLGTWAIAGAGWEFGWGAQDDEESLSALEYAVERGVNWIDTAAVYGLGHAEEIVGRLLRRVPASRRPLVFTKGSLVWDPISRQISHSLAPDSLLREIDESLRRLRTETIDLYQIHWPAFPADGPDDGIEAALSVLDRAHRQGKIRAIGVSNFDVAQLKRAQAVTEIASLQPPYSALMREVESDILPFCEQTGVGVIAYSTLQSGLLSGAMTRERIARLPDDDWRKTRSPDFREPRLTQNLALVETFRRIGDRHGLTPAAVAIAWVLRQPAISGAIVGARRPAQVDGLLGAAGFKLSEDELAEIAPFLPEGMGTNVPEETAS